MVIMIRKKSATGGITNISSHKCLPWLDLPGTMMVHFKYTWSTNWAMMTSVGLYTQTSLTISGCWNVHIYTLSAIQDLHIVSYTRFTHCQLYKIYTLSALQDLHIVSYTRFTHCQLYNIYTLSAIQHLHIVSYTTFTHKCLDKEIIMNGKLLFEGWKWNRFFKCYWL